MTHLRACPPAISDRLSSFPASPVCRIQSAIAALVTSVSAFVLLTSVSAFAQSSASSGADLPVEQFLSISAIPLYNGPVPGEKSVDPATAPFLTVFPPWEKSNGTAVIIAPGGGYTMLASNHEGRQEADWFAQLGVVAFVLKYRMGPQHRYPQPLQDAQRAIRLVRSRAADFGISPDRIGFMGFSAGGHLAAETGTEFDAGNPQAPDPVERVSSRPDFLVLGYPWLNAMNADQDGKSEYCRNIDLHDAELCERYSAMYSPERHVSHNTPPVFIFHTTTDDGVPVQASVSFYSALIVAKVPAEMHIFYEGPHGVGMGRSNPYLNVWPTLLEGWMRNRGLLKESSEK
ncbi:MAG TPA: alpha/beta hydrolase [Candidatus Sulfotelmatobacter sp.]|nr:alpha/beta hydrolase [Candidatus Sulfotelmatobacter sp.]